MQSQWLSYFLALSQHKSFAETAKQLAIDSSTLSRKMRQLEAELGVTLFSRFSRPLTLTLAGQRLLEHAPQLLQTLYQIENLPLHLQQRSLQLAWHGAWGIYMLPRLIRLFQTQLPAYPQIESHSLNAGDAFALFHSGLLDLWLSTYCVNGQRQLDVTPLKAQAHLELWGGPCSEFVIVGQPRPQRDWRALTYIQLSAFTFDAPLWDEGLYPRSIGVQLTSVSDAIALALHSDLAVYLPHVLVATLLQSGQLAIIAKAPERHTIQPGIVLNHALLGSSSLEMCAILKQFGFTAVTDQ
jgi:DNA-binding transcriptional LysR family regulator